MQNIILPTPMVQKCFHTSVGICLEFLTISRGRVLWNNHLMNDVVWKYEMMRTFFFHMRLNCNIFQLTAFFPFLECLVHEDEFQSLQ